MQQVFKVLMEYLKVNRPSFKHSWQDNLENDVLKNVSCFCTCKRTSCSNIHVIVKLLTSHGQITNKMYCK